MWNEGKKTFIAYEALEARRRVKIKSGTTSTPPEVQYAGAGEDHIGVTEFSAAAGRPVTVKLANVAGTFEIECVVSSAINRGTVLYGAASGKVSDASSGSAMGVAMETGADGDRIEVAAWGVKSTTAATVSILDAAGHTATATVEAALAEIYQHLLTSQAVAPLPLTTFTLADGTPLAKFADGDSATPGVHMADSKALNIRWNNHGTPTAIATTMPLPADFDPAADATLHVLASKSGATVGDATTFTIAAYNVLDGELHDGDADFGGATDALTGDATAKTVASLTRTLAAADLAAGPGVISLTLKPTDGLLGTDDVMVHGVWIEYQRKILTA